MNCRFCNFLTKLQIFCECQRTEFDVEKKSMISSMKPLYLKKFARTRPRKKRELATCILGESLTLGSPNRNF